MAITPDEAYFPNILIPRNKFYNIELKQYRLIFITSYHILLIRQQRIVTKLDIKFNLSLVFYYEILKLDLLDANLERYSEIQFQSCLSLHHPNCCDQFPCPSFNFSNHTYFFLVNQFHTRLLFTSHSVRKFHCIQGIFRQFEMAIAPVWYLFYIVNY
ncbi:hypothetical protein BLOT_011786 [Blomia tropicalis]|nr:hypothetical protein BLOT_011786 [Blomia tropicalis]